MRFCSPKFWAREMAWWWFHAAFTLLVALGGSCIAFALIEWGTQAALRAGYHL